MSQEGLSGFHEKISNIEQRIEKGDLKNERDYKEVKQEIFLLATKVGDIDTRLQWNEREVKEVKNDIKEIKGDTKWLRRTATAAFITTVTTGVLGGAIALTWTLIGR